ncbi:MAG: TolC family protein [Nevskia sp.]|nr:TolC family protein [Nevskia sp.]
MAADAGGTSFTLAQLIAAAQRDNKELQAARYAVDIGRARLVDAGLMPNPRIELSGLSDFAFRNEGAYTATVGLSQEFPIAGRILRQKDVARVDVALAQAEVEDAERRLAGEVAGDVYQLLLLDRQMQARDRLMAADQRLLRTAQARFKAAEVSELDVNTASIDLQRLAQERALLESQHAALLAKLNPLVGRPAEASLVLDEPPPPLMASDSPGALQAKALAARPDLRIAVLEADRAGAEKKLAEAKRWEDWSVGVGLQQDRQFVDGAPSQPIDRSLGVNLSIPLPLWNRNQGAIAAAQASADQAKARIEALKLAITGEVVAAQRELAGLLQILTHNERELLPVAERNVALAQKGYGQGLVSLLEVVQAQHQAAELETASLETLDRYAQALARLRTATSDYPLLSAPAQATATDTKEP